MRFLLAFLIIFLILGVVFRFLGFAVMLVLRFWYIAIPIAVYLYFRSKNSVKVVKREERSSLDPSKEVKLDKEPEVEDE